MSREITILVDDDAYNMLRRRAKEFPHGTKPEHVAADWIKERARATVDLDQKFRDAARIVDRRLATERNSD